MGLTGLASSPLGKLRPGEMASRSTRHWNEPTSIEPGTTRVRVGDPANVGQRPSGCGRRRQPVGTKRLGQDGEVRPFPPGEHPPGVRIRRGERLEVPALAR